MRGILTIPSDFDRRIKQWSGERNSSLSWDATIDTSNSHNSQGYSKSWREKRKMRADRAENNWISGGGGRNNRRGKKRKWTWRVVWNREQQIERSQGTKDEARGYRGYSKLHSFTFSFILRSFHNRTRPILLYTIVRGGRLICAPHSHSPEEAVNNWI